MSVDLSKLFQNIEIKLRGRTALVACGFATLAVMFWLVLRDYAAHPLLSVTGTIIILTAFIVILLAATLGKIRPDEALPKSAMHVGPVGIFFASGMTSQEELMQLVREWNGIKELPPPAARVDGSATQEKDYKPLSGTEADALIADINQRVQAAVVQEAQKLLVQIQSKQLPAKQGQFQIEGKAEPPEDKPR